MGHLRDPVLVGWPSERDTEDMRPVAVQQINLIVDDMAVTLAFYQRLGWTIKTPTDEHAVADLPNGLRVEFDSPSFASAWDSGYKGTTGGSTVLGLRTETRGEVDELYTDLVAQGHHGRQPPYDTFWGARFAIVDDPDGSPVGLMSPTEESRRFWPPSTPPQASPPQH